MNETYLAIALAVLNIIQLILQAKKKGQNIDLSNMVKVLVDSIEQAKDDEVKSIVQGKAIKEGLEPKLNKIVKEVTG